MSRPGTPHLQLQLYPLFFLSGASSLIFENLWQRKMMLVFGASAPSITVILTAFFLRGGLRPYALAKRREYEDALGPRASLSSYGAGPPGPQRRPAT